VDSLPDSLRNLFATGLLMSKNTMSESTVAVAGASSASRGDDSPIASMGVSLGLTLTLIAVMVLAGFNSRKRRKPPPAGERRTDPQSSDGQGSGNDDDDLRRY
jgi:hypothetical protein